MATELTCQGRVRTQDGQRVVVLEGERCPGCNGGCRLRWAASPTLPLGIDVPDGAEVEIVAASRRLTTRAALVFGLPLAAALLAAVLAQQATADAWWIAVAFLVAVAAMVGIRLATRRTPLPATPRFGDGTDAAPTIELDKTPIRIRIS